MALIQRARERKHERHVTPTPCTPLDDRSGPVVLGAWWTAGGEAAEEWGVGVQVVFEEVEERIGQGDGAVDVCGPGEGEGERVGGFGAGGEGRVLEVTAFVRHLLP
jgi:hypothetical protein